MDRVMNRVKVYGLTESVMAAKYPMAVDIDKLDGNIIPRTIKLFNAEPGSGHDQALTGIVVQFDLTFSNKAWVEAERYNWLDFVSSQSTMHRITKFDLTKQYNEYVDKMVIAIMQKKVIEYNDLSVRIATEDASQDVVDTWKEELKNKYLEILYTNPAGFRLTARMTTNYRQLKTIYYQRKNHRLPEWREFCKELEELPHFKEFCLGGDDVSI